MQLTQREFLFLEDVMAAEQQGVVQFLDFARHCTDPQLQSLCQQVAVENVNHYNRLLHILNQATGGHGTYQAQATGFDQNTGFAGPR